MDKKQKAIEELKKKIKIQRELLGPEGIKELERMAKGMQARSAPKPSLPPGMVPYDKVSAMKAFEFFLKNHGNPEEFKRRLLEEIKKKDH
jgi:hypothetical protein